MSTFLGDRILLIFLKYHFCQDGHHLLASASSEDDGTQPTICIFSSVSLSFTKFMFRLTFRQRKEFDTIPSKPGAGNAAVVQSRASYGTLELKQLQIVFISLVAGSLLTTLIWYRLFH
jgi:hypothetical protein